MTTPESYAVRARRIEPADSLDDFPTPPWAARALIEYGLKPRGDMLPLGLPPVDRMSAWEPAVNRGHLARGLEGSFRTVIKSDVYDYGVGAQRMDFRAAAGVQCDFVVTNPPFNLGVEFLEKAMAVSRHGCALLLRSSWIEGGARDKVFGRIPPSLILQFSGRVPLIKGYISEKATTATAYAWFVFVNGYADTRHRRIPAEARKLLTRPGDYPPYEEQARLISSAHLLELKHRHLSGSAKPPMPLEALNAELLNRRKEEHQ